MQFSRDVACRFKGAINSLWSVSDSSATDSRSAQGRSFVRSAAAVLCFAVLMFASQAHAQTAGSGSIQGVVTDPSGAVIPNAIVTLTEQSTQVTLTTKSNSGGNYTFPNIHVGNYDLTVVAQGFSTYIASGNILEVGSSISLNAKLTVGAKDTKVEVRANGLALQTEDPSFKQTIDRTEILEMPLNGRQVTDLITLAGGSNSNSTPGDSGGGNSKFPVNSAGISIAGAPGNTVSYRLDGGDNNDYMGGQNNPLPFPDALGQFSVETAALGAGAGTHIGGIVNVVTNSGTNTYHGSAFEFIRNNYLDATNFFATCTPIVPATTCSAKDTLHQNTYGGTFGGHVLRDKLFAFAAFQHYVSKSLTINQSAYVPTAANLAGDFSTTDPVASGQLIDPITGAKIIGNNYNLPGNTATLRVDPSIKLLLAQMPTPDPTTDTKGQGYIPFGFPVNNTENQFATRVDYTINAKNTMYVRYFLSSYQVAPPYISGSSLNLILAENSGNPEIRYQTVTIGENYIISPNIVNTVHLSGTRRQLQRGFNSNIPNMTAFNVAAYQNLPVGLWVNISTSGKNHGKTLGGGSNLLAVINDNVPVALSDDVTWVHGKHQIAFGGQFLRNQLNLNNGYQSNGDFTFNGQYSAASGVGDANLDFLEGAMSAFSQSKTQQNALRGSIPTLYVQDTFHATPSLTLTAGVRWQPEFFPVDVFHRGTTFSMSAFLANQHSQVYPNAPAGTFYYGDPGVKAAFTNNTPWQFSPNFGVSYDLFGNGKTVVRAGAEYAYDDPNFFVEQRVQQNPPFSAIALPNSSGQLCFSNPWLIGGNTNNNTTQGCAQVGGTNVDPFPALYQTSPATAIFAQQSQYIVLPSKYQSPNTVQWTASIQQQFSHGWTAQIFYTGSRTQHLLTGTEFNPAVYIPGVWGQNISASAPYGCPGVVTGNNPAAQAAGTVTGGPVGSPCSINSINSKTWVNPATGKAQTITVNTQARYALAAADPTSTKSQGNLYAGGSGGSLIETNNGAGNYNGVIATVQHRFSSAFSILANYTWSKCLNNSDPQGDISGGSFSNPNNPAIDYGRCGQNQDVRNIFNTSLVLRSAFPLHGVTGYMVNNWELAPLVRILSGTAINVTQSQDVTFTGNGGDRPNLVPGVNPYNYTKIVAPKTGGAVYATQSYLNQNAFVDNTVYGTQGTVSRNEFNGPMYFQADAQISRIFPIYERFKLDLRLEAFNLLNHPSFGNPGSSGPTFTPSTSFGVITGTSTTTSSTPQGARVFQAAGKITF